MNETEERVALVIDERLANMNIFDALNGSHMLRCLINLDTMTDIGAFLNSFCPHSTKITAGYINVSKF